MKKPEQASLRFAGGVEKKTPPAKPRKPKKRRNFAPHGYSDALVARVSEYGSQHMALEIKSGYYFLQNLEKWGFTELQINYILDVHMSNPLALMVGLVELCNNMIDARKAKGTTDPAQATDVIF